MSIKEVEPRAQAEAEPRSFSIPPLNPGDRLSRAEFERRYEAHPEIKKAELVEGVVYMPSPLRFAIHSEPHGWLITWIGVYVAATPGVRLGDNATVRLDFENEVQPDVLLRLEPERGGRSHLTAEDYIEGPPELIVEIAASSAAYDLHDKLRVYQRSGVQEYLAAQMYEQRADWFVLREGVYEPLTPDETGMLRSQVFPGLGLKPAALFSADLAAILTTVQQGIASPEHAAFVEKMQSTKQGEQGG
jgi:Uma2 family endonuclease